MDSNERVDTAADTGRAVMGSGRTVAPSLEPFPRVVDRPVPPGVPVAPSSIPEIESYPLPTDVELPVAQVDWQLEPERAVLLVHDMQRYFVRPFLEPLRSALVANIVEVRARARERHIPVVYTAQPGGMTVAERGLLLDVWGPGMTRDEADRSIVAELTPGPDEVVLTKWRYSALVHTDLLDRMAAQGRDQLIVCGVFAHVGVLVTAIDAFSHDIQPFVLADAMADFSSDYHTWAVDYASRRCAVVRTVAGLFG